MVVQIPPGLAYLCLNLPRVFTPAITVYSFAVIIRRAFDIRVSPWLMTLTYISLLPVAFCLSVLWRDLENKRRANSLGAVLPPRISGRLPGSVDMLWIGSKLRYTAYPGDRLETWLEENNNTLAYNILFEDRIFTTEPEYIKSILATNFDNFEKGKTFNELIAPLLGTGVFNSDGDRWKFHRSMTRPFFTQDRIKHFQIFDRHAEDAIAQMRARFSQGYAVDIQDVVSRFTLDCATEFLFDTDVCSLSAGLNYPPGHTSATRMSGQHPSNVFANSFVSAQETMAKRFDYSTAWPMIEFWQDRIKKRMDVIRSFIDPIVERALMKKGSNEMSNANGNGNEEDDDVTLLEHLVKLTDDPTIIKDETLNIMIAGRDTTASTLTFVVGMLAQHSNVLARLRREILSKVGTTKTPTYDDLRDMKYLRAVINETLRLYPPVPFNIRFSTKETIWPSVTGGKTLYVPKNTMCVYSVFLMHRRKDLWGPDALEFDPDRFLDDRLRKYLIANPYIFLPFNAGPRICLGQQFAYNEVSLMIIRLLQSFSEISLDPDANPASNPPSSWAQGEGRRSEEKIWLKTHLTMYAHNGCWVRMKEAVNVEG